jgi:hypothetical protein
MISINKLIVVILLLVASTNEKLFCQETTEAGEQQIENNAMAAENNMQDINESEVIGDEMKFDINTINETELIGFNLLTQEQINNFIIYRKRMGRFISLFELQAVPGWDIETIRSVINKLKFKQGFENHYNFKQLLKKTNHSILYRTGGKAYDTLVAGILKGKTNMINSYKQLIKYSMDLSEKIKGGITIEKDAGEKNIVDHLSGYLAFSSNRILKNCIIGDYTINMGQGLIQWQGYSVGLSNQISSGFRQGPIVMPHRGTDENKFHRGIALGFQKSGITLSLLGSSHYVDANIIWDSSTNKKNISSFLVSGIHVSDSEISDKKTAGKKTIGGSLTFKFNKTSIGLNHLSTFFDSPIKKSNEPYNYFSKKGNNYKNTGIDVETNILSGFLFGEVAVDEKLNSGFIIGFIKSIDPRLDIAFKYRNISKGFRSFQSSAFTQNTEANNEQGKSITVNFKVNSTTKIEGYADHFINYWPQYYNDGIRRGNIISIQYSWDPNKKTSYYIRLQSKEKDNNGKLNNNKTNLLGKERISNYRIHFSFSPYQSITVRYRTELSVYTGEFKHTERGFLSYLEIIYKPMLKPYSISARLSGFETGGYNSRIYAYERDILYYYAIPALQNLGFRNYILVNYKISKQLQIWLKWIHAKNTLNSPLSSQAESSVRITKEWRVQLIWKS